MGSGLSTADGRAPTTPPTAPTPAPSTTPSAAPSVVAPDGLLDLAGTLAMASSLTAHVDATLPVVARLCDATVVTFAVAGSEAAGVRCWPSDLAWAGTLREALGASWETGPLTLWCREVGVVPAVRIHDVLGGWGTEPWAVLRHSDRVLHELLVIPVACTGRTVAAYLAARYEEPFDDAEVALARAAQSVIVASHGRFLRPPEPALTGRQHSVLRLLAEGRTVRAIGSRLGISQSTVDKHVRDLYRRLGTQDRASTIRAAQVRGLLDGLVGENWQDLLIVSDP